MSSMSITRCPVLDPTGRAMHTEATSLREAPAVLVELPGPVRAWAVTRHSVIQALTNDPRVSRDLRRHWPGLDRMPEGWPLAALALQQSFFNFYGEEHRRSRRRVAPTFSPRQVARMRPQVQATADLLIDALAELPPGTVVDVRQALALPLTITVISDLFGVPDHLRTRIGKGIDAVLNSSLGPEEALAANNALYERLGELLRYKREHPAADLTSDLLLPSDPGQEPMPEDVLLGTLFLMIGAGYETTVNLITSAVQAVLDHPETLARIHEGAIGWPDVIEETLRVEGPIMHIPMRCALDDIDLGDGVVIRKGDAITVGFAAAGRDPELHPQCPERFDPTRSSKEHLAFGHGPHFCLGAHLARLEADVALSTLFGRLPDLALAHPGEQPARVESFIINGPVGLEVVPRPA
ncbi:cytochrome P450 family protein [Streptomyces fuscichromogenes]|uniref:Cytochrome P450 n=1 Tax=Streptomyces fuscichromogenes TaxID=1324013 RepID=A0A918CY37_9ACTN|nr:cytochrome P450 [Streptomyces fuscichromogenes]GGN46934.1 cytochrome P450 [Streptomyces fuscichromogenes]